MVPAIGSVIALGLYSAECVSALSARVSAVWSGEPALLGLGRDAAGPFRATAYAYSRPALPANARLNAANEPCVVLGPAVEPTEAKPGGTFTGSGI